LDVIVSALYSFFVEKLPYITIAVFFAGVILRFNRWFSASKGPKGVPLDFVASIKYIILDVVFFRKTFKTDKIAWVTLMLFHLGVAGILFGHMRGFNIWSASMFEPLGHDVADFMVHSLPVYVGWVFIATQVILLMRRGVLERQKLFSRLMSTIFFITSTELQTYTTFLRHPSCAKIIQKCSGWRRRTNTVATT